MKSVKMFGKSIPILGILLIAMLAIGGVSAAVVNYLSNTVTKPATVASPIALTGTMEYWPAKQNYLFEARGTGVNPAGAWWAPDGKSGYSALLFVTDGGTDWTGVDIEVDIALKDIATLNFWEKIDLLGANGWDVNVVLGIDVDGDGKFEADLPKWHGIGGTMHQTADLHGDRFIEMDGKLGPLTADLSWTEIDALDTPRWWTPNAAGDGLSLIANCKFANLPTDPLGTWDMNIPDTDVKVKLIKLVIGGAGSWMNEKAYVDLVTVNGVEHNLEPVIVTEGFNGVAFTPTLYGGSEFFMRFDAENLANRDMWIMLALVMQCPGTWTPNDPALEIWEIQPFGQIVAAGLSEPDLEYLVYVFDLQNIGPGSIYPSDIKVQLTPIAEPGAYTIKAFIVWGDIIEELSDEAAVVNYVLGL